MNSIKNIFLLYVRNSGFMILSLCLMLGLIIFKLLFHFRYLSFAEEIFDILFVATLWIAFHMGLLLKQQFANWRASLLPNYRRRHLQVSIILYMSFIVLACLWKIGLHPSFDITSHGLWGIYLCCLLAAISITVLGYLSIGRLIMYGYVLILIISTQSFSLLDFLDHTHYWNYALVACILLITLIFFWRLMTIKEEGFEFSYFLSWPPKNIFRNQWKASYFFNSPGITLAIPAYPRNKSLFARARHWEYTEESNLKGMGIVMILSIPLYLWLIKNQLLFQNFDKNVYTNFLLLSISPVLITIGANYKKMIYWGYDLLKPVSKNVFMKEKGIILLNYLILSWMSFVIFLAVIPNLILQPRILLAKKFWGYLILTGSCAVVILSWIFWLSCIREQKKVIVQGILLGFSILIPFYCIPEVSFTTVLIMNIIFIILGCFLLPKAYHAWCEKEFY